MKTRARTYDAPARQGSLGSLIALMPVLLVMGASITLTSCIGYTSAAPNGSEKTFTGGGLLTPNSDTVSFGEIAVGATGTQTISLTNTGTATANVSDVKISGSGFKIANGHSAVSIAAGQSASWQVQFAPTSNTDSTGTISVTSDAANGRLGIKLKGTGTLAILDMSPTALNFNNVQVGQTSNQTVTLQNTGNASVKINSATVSGNGFAISGIVFLLIARAEAAEITLVPRQTIETLRENAPWIKNRT